MRSGYNRESVARVWRLVSLWMILASFALWVIGWFTRENLIIFSSVEGQASGPAPSTVASLFLLAASITSGLVSIEILARDRPGDEPPVGLAAVTICMGIPLIVIPGYVLAYLGYYDWPRFLYLYLVGTHT